MRFFYILIFMICGLNGYSQFSILWQQSYGGSEGEEAIGIVPLGNGYLMAGSILSTDGQITCAETSGRSWLLNIDSNGDILGDFCYENHGVSAFYQAIGTNNLYLIGASDLEQYNYETNIGVIKLDSNYSEIWRKGVGNYIGICYDNGGIVTSDGGVLAYAQICSGGGDVSQYYGPHFNAWLAKITANGELQWDCTFGNSTGSSFIHGITELSTGGYLAALYCDATSSGNGNIKCYVDQNGIADIVVYKIDAQGNPLEQWCYGGSDQESLKNIIELDDGFLLVGGTKSNDGDMSNSGHHGNWDVWVARIDFNGDIIWQKCYGGTNMDYGDFVHKTSDGGFMIFANTESWDCDVVGNIPDEDPSIWIFKINGDGDLIWQQPIRGDGFEGCHDVVKINDDKYVMAGYMSLSPSYDVVCSNFVPLSYYNFYALEIEVTYVGYEIYSQDSTVKIYPNPATDEITVELTNKLLQAPVSIDIINMSGDILRSYKQCTFSKDYDIRILPPGIYLLRVRNQEFVGYAKVIVKYH